MANDIQDRLGQILGSDSARSLAGTAVSEALKAVGGQRPSNGDGSDSSPESSRKGLSGLRGLAAGAGAAALAPMAAKGIGKLVKGNGAEALSGGPKKLVGGAVSKLGDTVSSEVHEKVDEAGGPSGMLKEGLKSALPFGGGGGGGGGKQDAEGVGKGRRMPIQQSVDIGLPIETVYNQWTQFEEWPKFMHRVTRATQEDPCKVSFAVKIWGKTKEFTADIETQRPNDRIKWKTTQGMTHTGLVAFRELGPNLTRVLLSFDVAPGGLVEKYARGARYVKRAARADLHRFVAFIEMLENESGAWRGVIEDGELVEDHDPSYDEEREYGSADELVHGRGSEEDEDEESDEEAEDEGSDEEAEDGDSEDEEDEPRARNGGEPSPRAQRRSSESRQGSRGGGSGGSSRAQSQKASSRSTRGSSKGRSSSGNGGGSSSGSTSGRSSKSGSSGSSRSSGSGSRSSGSSRSGSSSRSSSGRSSGSSSGGSRSSGRSRGTSRSSGSDSGDHQGRPRNRSSRRS